MGRKRKDENELKVSRNISLPFWMWKRISKAAETEKMNVSNYIEKLIKTFIKR